VHSEPAAPRGEESDGQVRPLPAPVD
jgi:hypothetical protein